MMQRFKGQFTTMSLAMTAAATVLTLAIRRLITSFAKFGDELAKSAARSGLTINAYAQIGHALTLTGANAGFVERAIRGMNRVIYDGSRGLKEATDAFEALGVPIQDLFNMSPEERFSVLVEALSHIPDTGLQAALAMRVFGRAGVQMIPLLQQGAEGMQMMREEAALLGGDLEASSRSAEVVTDWFARLKLSVDGLVAAIGHELTDDIVELLSTMTAYVVAIREAINTNPELLDQFVSMAKTVVGLIVGIGGLITTIALIATPVGQIILIVIALLGLADAVGLVDTGFGMLFSNIKIGSNSIAGHWNRMSDLLVDVFLSAFEGIQVGFDFVLTKILNGLDRVMQIYHKIKGGIFFEYDSLGENRAIDKRISERNRKSEEYREGRYKAGEDRRRLSEELYAADAAKESLSESIKNRVGELKGLFAGFGSPPTEPQGDGIGFDSTNIAAPTRGVHGFFGGQSVLEQLGFAKGSSVEERTLEEQRNQTDILTLIERNTRESGGLTSS